MATTIWRRPAIGLWLLALLLTAPAAARNINVAGDFDFYVLSLSWSPSYCEAEGSRADRSQCSAGRPYAFVVHGLWPQYERGFPEFCRALPSRAPETVVRAMLDVMPSPNLVRHEWEKHGVCSGMTPQGYFAKLRAARDRIAIPPAFVGPRDYRMVGTMDVERSFQAANPGLQADAVAVTCDSRRLREVRICMTKDLRFRPCPEIDRRACRNPRLAVPPVR
ncbi:MAG: ribonuclease T2 [Rhodobiaceae bacterium]|nr:ribonuclease T2 [Rhodobiaceae bacterium]MCC0056337.1 ribonuclease T2 [Rhodobiaceae bacterium]